MSDNEARLREAEVLGAPMRIAAVPQGEIAAEVRGSFNRLRAAVGYEPIAELPTYFAMLAHHPDVFCHQMQGGMMNIGETSVPKRERELAVLRAAWLAGAPYAWSEHVFIGRHLGLTPEDTDRVRAGPDAPGWSAHERALLSAVDELVERRMISDPVWAALAEAWNPRQIIEFIALVGQYLAIIMIQNAVRVPLDEGRHGFADR